MIITMTQLVDMVDYLIDKKIYIKYNTSYDNYNVFLKDTSQKESILCILECQHRCEIHLLPMFHVIQNMCMEYTMFL